jgi:hypothetical protein
MLGTIWYDLFMEEKEMVESASKNRDIPTAVEFFDPPMCCPTGLCGPALDQTLLDVNEMVLALKAAGIGVERYQMSTNPNAFLGNADVMRLVREQNMAALPITVVQGRVVKTGSYPTRDEIEESLNREAL